MGAPEEITGLPKAPGVSINSASKEAWEACERPSKQGGVTHVVSINSASKEAWEHMERSKKGNLLMLFPLIPLQRKRGRG